MTGETPKSHARAIMLLGYRRKGVAMIRQRSCGRPRTLVPARGHDPARALVNCFQVRGQTGHWSRTNGIEHACTG